CATEGGGTGLTTGSTRVAQAPSRCSFLAKMANIASQLPAWPSVNGPAIRPACVAIPSASSSRATPAASPGRVMGGASCTRRTRPKDRRRHGACKDAAGRDLDSRGRSPTLALPPRASRRTVVLIVTSRRPCVTDLLAEARAGFLTLKVDG